jgi:hypothetical protein
MPAIAARARQPLPRRGRSWSAAGTYATAQLTNTFEGGTSGNALTQGVSGNSGGTSGNFFDTVTIGGGATDAFDNTHAAHGSLSCKIATGSSAAVYNTWSVSLTNTGVQQAWFRLYLYFTANPANQHRVLAATASGSVAAALSVTTAGKLLWTDAGGSAIYTSATAIPLNSWFRIEGFVTGSGEGAGQVSLSLYTTPDSVAPVEAYTSPATQNTAGLITDVRYGVSAAAASVGPYWMDDIGVSTLGALGPSLVPGAGGGSGGQTSIALGQAVIMPGTAATPLFTAPPGLCSVTFYNLGSTSAWIGTSTAATSANGMQCSSVPTSFTGYTGSRGATFYGTTGSTVATSVATIQFIIVTAH